MKTLDKDLSEDNSSAEQQTTSVGIYLLDRLKALGVEHVFGLPGDYVLRFDKLIEEHSIQLINTTREDTAGYAADAYARVKGVGAACITYGVGINIVNATAQAYVESSPIVIISGTASKKELLKSPLLHHMINKSHSLLRDTTQLEIFKQITVDQAILDNPETAAENIDRVLKACIYHHKPVYIEIPKDIVDMPLIPGSYKAEFIKKSNPEALKEALDEIRKLLNQSNKPLLWLGRDIKVYHQTDHLLAFAEKYQIPIASTLLGKTIISEWHPLFVGLYQGAMSKPEVNAFVEECDCILSLGIILSDVNTGFFSDRLEEVPHVIVSPEKIRIGQHEYPDVLFYDILEGIGDLILNKEYACQIPPKESFNEFVPKDAILTTERVFECIQTHLTPEHVIISDVGDCLFASSDLVLEKDSYIASAYFAALGSGVPEAIGMQIADPKRRAFAIVGDGGFQMSAMELSTAVRYGLDPIIIVLNNHGYGTERPLLEGKYNDIVNWNYFEIPTVLDSGIGLKVFTEQELQDTLLEAVADRENFYIIDVELGKTDFSPALRRFFEYLQKMQET